MIQMVSVALESDGSCCGNHIQEHFLRFLEVQRVPIQYGCMANTITHAGHGYWLLKLRGFGG